jgi:hypothetical protein
MSTKVDIYILLFFFMFVLFNFYSDIVIYVLWLE